jgi:hypothetical protein
MISPSSSTTIDGYTARDSEGTELPDIYAAQEQAIHMSGEILREMGGKFWSGTERRLEVTNEQGQILLALRFSAEKQPVPPDQRRKSGAPWRLCHGPGSLKPVFQVRGLFQKRPSTRSACVALRVRSYPAQN